MRTPHAESGPPLTRIRRIAVVALATALAACATAQAKAPVAPIAPPPPRAAPRAFANVEPEYVFADPDRLRKLESAFPAIDTLGAAELKAHGVPGFVLGVVIDGKLAYAKGFGVADLGTNAPPDADTIYRIGSISKSFTALAVLAVRDDGAFGLDDPITGVLPEAAGLVYPTRDAAPITLQQMLTHTSGLPRLGAFDYTRQDREPSEPEIMKTLAGFALAYAPGTVWEYSNLAYGLLGIAVGRASHSSLREVVRKKITDPLGMASTTFDPATLPKARFATGYRKRAAPLTGYEPAPQWRLGASEGAGGIYSTLRDMARYVAFQLDAYPARNAPEAAGVRRSSVREAHFNALKTGPLHVAMRTDWPAKGESLVAANAGAYGYAWSVGDTCDFDRLVSHNGAVGGFHAIVSFLPASGVGVLGFANSEESDVEVLVDKAFHALRKTGGLSARIRRPKLLPAFAPAMARLLAVYNAWDDAAYKAMLTPKRPAIAPSEERAELGRYKSFHGACTGYEPIEVISAHEARLALKCERGALEMFVGLDPGDGLIAGFAGTSHNVTADHGLAKVAAVVAELIGKWDDAAYTKHLAPEDKRTRLEAAKYFTLLRTMHHTCAVTSFTRTEKTQDFLLTCEHGGDLRLTLALNTKNPDVATSYALASASGGKCPTK